MREGMSSKSLIMFQFLNTWLSFDNSRRLLLGFDSPIEAGILLAVIILWVRFTAWPLSSFLKKGVVIASNNFDRIEGLIRNLSTKGLFIETRVKDEYEANKLIEMAKFYGVK